MESVDNCQTDSSASLEPQTKEEDCNSSFYISPNVSAACTAYIPQIQFPYRGRDNSGNKCDHSLSFSSRPGMDETKERENRDDYLRSTADSMDLLRRQNCFTDVSVLCGGRTFAAHKIVLIASCPYFSSLFLDNDCDVKTATLWGIDPDIFHLLLRYMYTGVLELPQTFESIKNLMHACHFLQLPNFSKNIANRLWTILQPKTSFGMWDLAEEFEDKDMAAEIVKYMAENFEVMWRLKEYGTLSPIRIKMLLKQAVQMKDISNDSLLRAIFLWIQGDTANRAKELPNLLRFIKVPKLSSAMIINVLDNEPLLQRCEWFHQALVTVLSGRNIKTRGSGQEGTPRKKSNKTSEHTKSVEEEVDDDDDETLDRETIESSELGADEKDQLSDEKSLDGLQQKNRINSAHLSRLDDVNDLRKTRPRSTTPPKRRSVQSVRNPSRPELTQSVTQCCEGGEEELAPPMGGKTNSSPPIRHQSSVSMSCSQSSAETSSIGRSGIKLNYCPSKKKNASASSKTMLLKLMKSEEVQKTPHLLVFGRDRANSIVSFTYSIAKGSWQKSEDFPDACRRKAFDLPDEAAFVAFKDKIFILGGWNRVKKAPTNICYEYNSGPILINQIASLKMARHMAGAAALGEFVYIVGGIGRWNTPISHVERYHTVELSWSDVEPLPTWLSEPAVIAFNDKLYVIGGKTNEGFSLDCFYFDPVLDQWTKISDLPTDFTTSVPIATVHKGVIYATRESHTENPRRMWCLELSDRSWQTSKNEISLPCRRSLSLMSWKQKLWVVDIRGKLFSMSPNHRHWQQDVTFASCIPHPVFAAIMP